MNCSIARALDEVGEWWTLLIVREATQGACRFDDFLRGLGIARNILTTRLERLVELGIFERFPLTDRANTDGYRLKSHCVFAPNLASQRERRAVGKDAPAQPQREASPA